MTALESSVQTIREEQQQDRSKDIMDLVTAQLQTFEAQIDAKIRGWTASNVKGCQELEDTLGGVQEQLGEIQRRQTEFQAACDSILHRLEQLESSRLRSIPEVSVSPPGSRAVDSVQSFAQTREEWEKRVGTREKDFSLSRTTIVLQEPSRVVVEDQETAHKGKRSPSPEDGSPWASAYPKSFAAFTLGGKTGTGGYGGTSGGGGPPEGPPGGPSGGGGGDPGDGFSRGQVPRFGDPVPAAALKLWALCALRHPLGMLVGNDQVCARG